MAEVDHDSLESSRSSIFQTEVDVQDKEPAKRVEEEKFMFSVKGQSLPKAAQFPVIAEDVAESMGIAEGLALRRWRRYFHSPKCKAIITDLFWYCYCTFYKKNKTKESVKRLQDRVAENYAAMLYEVTIQNGDRDLFLPGLTNAMAQAVFLSFYQSYPRSRVKFDETFNFVVLEWDVAYIEVNVKNATTLMYGDRSFGEVRIPVSDVVSASGFMEKEHKIVGRRTDSFIKFRLCWSEAVQEELF